MAAPFGNQFWKLADVGAERKFADPNELWEKACAYFNWCDENPYQQQEWVGKDGEEVTRFKPIPYTKEGLYMFLNIDRQTFTNYSSKEGYEAFFAICSRISDTIHNQKFTGASIGIFNANIIARDLGLVDKAESKTDGKQEIIVKYERKRSNTK